MAIEVDELGYNDRNIDYEIQRQRAIEKELGCVFIRINPDEKNFNIFRAINKIHRHIKKSTKKSLIDKITKRLLKLEFKSNHSIITKALKRVVKNVLPDYKKLKNTQSKVKPIKIRKQSGTTNCFRCKDYTQNFRPQEERMTNKVLREKSHCVVCRSNKSRFLKQKIN